MLSDQHGKKYLMLIIHMFVFVQISLFIGTLFIYFILDSYQYLCFGNERRISIISDYENNVIVLYT
jgi:hypothetical protein